MALGNTNRENSDHKLFILKIRTKILDKDTNKEIPCVPHVMQVLEKTDGKWTAKDETITSFSGNLAKIEFDTGEWEGSEYNIIKLKFIDDEAKEDYILDCRTSSDFRSLANSILALDPSNTSGLRINLYKTTSKVNGKDYSNVSLWQGETHIKGKYTWEEMPAVEKVKFKGKDMSDTSKLDDWTIEKLKDFAGKMMGQVKVTKTTKKEDSGGSYKNVSPEIENEDIPF
jgi:hypothetical protein